jgi:hypothetical protein
MLISLLGWGLRLSGLTRDGYWIDEASAVLVATHRLPDIVKGLGVRLHPPLFYFLLHTWMQVGNGTFFVRLFSVLCGVLTVGLVYRLTRDLQGQRSGLVAAFLLAISPAHIWYSQEARMYALLVLLCTLSFYLGWRWTEEKRAVYWIGYTVTSTAALYTQYMAAFVLIAGTIGFTLLLGTQRRYRDLAFWWLAQACVALAFLPWLPTWMAQTGFDTPWITRPAQSDITRTWVYLAFGAAWRGDGWSILRLVLVLGVIGLALGHTVWRKGRDTLLLPTIYALVPALLLTGVSFLKPIYQDKQFLIVLPPLMMITAWAMTRGKPIHLLAGVILFSTLTVGPLCENYFVKQKQQWREASRYIESHWEPGDVIYYNAGVASAGTALYLDDSLAQVGYPILWDVLKGGRYGAETTVYKVDTQFHRLAQRYQRVWLVQYFPAYWDPGGYITDWLAEHAHRETIPTFDGVDLQLHVLDRED